MWSFEKLIQKPPARLFALIKTQQLRNNISHFWRVGSVKRPRRKLITQTCNSVLWINDLRVRCETKVKLCITQISGWMNYYWKLLQGKIAARWQVCDGRWVNFYCWIVRNVWQAIGHVDMIKYVGRHAAVASFGEGNWWVCSPLLWWFQNRLIERLFVWKGSSTET